MDNSARWLVDGMEDLKQPLQGNNELAVHLACYRAMPVAFLGYCLYTAFNQVVLLATFIVNHSKSLPWLDNVEAFK